MQFGTIDSSVALTGDITYVDVDNSNGCTSPPPPSPSPLPSPPSNTPSNTPSPQSGSSPPPPSTSAPPPSRAAPPPSRTPAPRSSYSRTARSRRCTSRSRARSCRIRRAGGSSPAGRRWGIWGWRWGVSRTRCVFSLMWGRGMGRGKEANGGWGGRYRARTSSLRIMAMGRFMGLCSRAGIILRFVSYSLFIPLLFPLPSFSFPSAHS